MSERSRSILAKGGNVATLGQLFGAFVIIYLLSKQAVIFFGKWYDGTQLLAAAHGGTLALAWFVAAIGASDKGVPDWGIGAIFLLPSLIWFLVALSQEQKDAVEKAVAEYPAATKSFTIRKGRDEPTA
jgi:hypothetical protein